MHQYLTLTVADAAYHTVHDYPGGAAALGLRLGKSNVSAEVDQRVRGAKFGLLDAVKTMHFARDYRMLYAMAAELDHYPPIPRPPGPGASQQCLETLGELALKAGRLMQEVAQGVSDNVVDDNELAAATARAGELTACMQQLLAGLLAMNHSHKVARGVAA